MGHVFHARDMRLGRDVAIKVLAPRVSADEATRKRFMREARAISALNDPNICALYDIGRENGHDFLVMEYVQGETLAQRLVRGAMPLDEALRFAIDIAAALQVAHGKGIVHRDLKPSNVMLSPAGAKLLDFGLARLAHSDESRALTGEGMAIGTVDYMAPEQINGHDADVRTDIFAFGIVLYEMLTGERPFRGDSPGSVVGAILFSEPLWVDGLAPALARVIGTCLQKRPEDRFQTAHDLKLQLQWLRDGGGESEPGVHIRPGRRKVGRAWMTAAAAVALVTGGLLLGRLVGWRATNDRPPSPPTLSMIDLPSPVSDATAPAISPDGRSLAAVVTTAEDTVVMLRGVADGSQRTVPNTNSATWVGWAPDARHILFATLQKIGRIDTVTGAVTILADGVDPRGATENLQGDVVYAPSYAGTPLLRIPAQGGKPVPVTKLGPGETSHRWPQFLPDGRHFVYFASLRNGDKEFGRVCIAAIDSPAVSCPLAASSQALFIAPNILLTTSDGVVKAFEFDPDSMAVKRPLANLPDVDVFDDNGFMLASASTNGLLTYMDRSAKALKTLQWIDRSGKAVATLGGPSSYETVELSHDGRKLAVVDDGDIWIDDLERGLPTRITFAGDIEREPRWSPDDRQLAYNRSRPGHYETRIRPAVPVAGSGIHVLDKVSPVDWSPDGRYLALGSSQLLAYGLRERRITPLTSDPMGYGSARFSPDGRWIAYTSNISGTYEVYIDSFPTRTERIQVSAGGANWPRWRRDGKELYFVVKPAQLTAVTVEHAGGHLRVGTPQPLFDIGNVIDAGYLSYAAYDVSPDGKRFIVLRRPDAQRRPIMLVTNCLSALGR